jgi:hypothetical protein
MLTSLHLKFLSTGLADKHDRYITDCKHTNVQCLKTPKIPYEGANIHQSLLIFSSFFFNFYRSNYHVSVNKIEYLYQNVNFLSKSDMVVPAPYDILARPEFASLSPSCNFI